MFFISLLLFALVFTAFVFGVSPSVYGGDSGDIIISAWFAGIAHAPGYPLNSLIGWLFTHLPYYASVAFKANLMAAFFQSGIVLFVFLTLTKLTKNTLVSLAAAFTLAFTTLFWLYAHIIEVFQLNTLLVSVSVYFLISWRDKELLKTHKESLLYLSIFFLGLAVFHHQTSVLVLPAFIYMVLRTKRDLLRKKKVILKSALAFCLGFLPYLYLPVASLLDVPTNWDNATNLVSFLKIITRSDYGTFVAADSLIGPNFISRLAEIANYFLFLRADFQPLGLIFIVLGTVTIYFKDKVLFWFFTIAVLLTGPFFLFYAAFPIINDFYYGLLERFLLLSYFFITFLIAFGYWGFYLFIKNSLLQSSFLKKSKIRPVVSLLFLLIFFLPVSFYFKDRFKADLSDFTLGDSVAEDILASSADNGLIFLLGDTQTFNTEYVYYTNDTYKSRKIVRAGSLGDLDYRARFKRFHPHLNYPSDFLDKDNINSEYHVRSLIESNIDKFPIYFYANPVSIENYRWTATGLLKRLVRNDQYSKEDLIKVNKDLFSGFLSRDFNSKSEYTQFMSEHLKETYFLALEHTALEIIDNNLNDEADYYLNQALILFPDGKDIYAILGNQYLLKKDCEKSRQNYEKVLSLDPKEWKALEAIGKVYEQCFGDTNKAQSYLKQAQDLKSKLQGDTLN